jgi:hypothetical protein
MKAADGLSVPVEHERDEATLPSQCFVGRPLVLDQDVEVWDFAIHEFSLKPLPEHRLRVRFDDGTEGTIDVAQMVKFTDVFKPLQNPAFFAQARVNTELGTICWPNDADLDSDVMYAKVTGQPIPQYLTVKK